MPKRPKRYMPPSPAPPAEPQDWPPVPAPLEEPSDMTPIIDWPEEPADSLLNLVEFRAKREPDGTCKIDVVYREMTKELTPDRSQVLLHFSDRFGWGTRGADAVQTAIAILLEATNSEDFAWRLHEEFERQIIGTFPPEGWTMPRESIYFWIDINDPALLPSRHRSPEGQDDKS